MTLLNRFKLHVNWSTIVFILNLAFVDLLYCMIGIPHYSLMLVHKKWDWGANACKKSCPLRFLEATENHGLRFFPELQKTHGIL